MNEQLPTEIIMQYQGGDDPALRLSAGTHKAHLSEPLTLDSLDRLVWTLASKFTAPGFALERVPIRIEPYPESLAEHRRQSMERKGGDPASLTIENAAREVDELRFVIADRRREVAEKIFMQLVADAKENTRLRAEQEQASRPLAFVRRWWNRLLESVGFIPKELRK